jgi:polyketide biosynthesis 3-hydroxy-3-methylglutaryl-CoA synthase-like enzyme PksG
MHKMSPVGIEALNVFAGTTFVNLERLAGCRGLDRRRFENLLMREKTVALPCEDPVTFAVNAAAPIILELSASERARIELLITCSESGVDFGKSISTYVHEYLQLSRTCRMFELKQACYSGTAGLQMACNFILSGTAVGAKALVIATDISRGMAVDGVGGSDELHKVAKQWSYAEPSTGAGAVALLVSASPHVFQLDIGASGYYGYEVMDTCRPVPDGEAGDADLSLLSYLDCCERSFAEYQKRVSNVSFGKSFQYLVFHTPFGGMVKGAHRNMMRKHGTLEPSSIDLDFQQRVLPGLSYCQRVGNIMGGTIFVALASCIDNATFASPQRVGCFSYGSGCCSEFYSGIIRPDAQRLQRHRRVGDHLNGRRELTVEEYDEIQTAAGTAKFGTRNVTIDKHWASTARRSSVDRPLLYLDEIREFHRGYKWVS